MIKNLLPASFLLILFSTFCLAQNKVDIQLKVQLSSNTARGGESFSYTVTTTNIGSIKATDMIFIQREPKTARFVSYVPDKGNCEIEEKRYTDRILHCYLNDMEPGESVITTIELKIYDFGDISQDSNSKVSQADKSVSPPNLIAPSDSPEAGINKKLSIPNSPFSGQPGQTPELSEEPQAVQSELIDISGYAAEEDINKTDNQVSVFIELLPSTNIPPRVQILTPKTETVITRFANQPTEVKFLIKAFDPDGKIEKVIVNTNQFFISVEYPENKYVIEGKKYSIKEVEENREAFKKYLGGEATKIGPDTYIFTLINPKYLFNDISVMAVDNGGRTAFGSVNLLVKGNNSIEFTKPAKEAMIQPQTDIVIETTSKLYDSKPVKMELIGPYVCCTETLMKVVSQNGNIYMHQYILKNVPRGYYALQVLLTEESGAVTFSKDIYFKVDKKPEIKITSLKNGQSFGEDEKIPIEIETTVQNREIKDIAVNIDGKYDQFSWNTGGYNKSGFIYNLPKGIHKIFAVVTDDMNIRAQTEPITIVVK